MTDYNNGGPAFPITAGNAVYGRGMTLRDWFAGQALAGYFAYKWAERQNTATIDTANYIYQMADAMIAARGK
jgi:hypothetical protein